MMLLLMLLVAYVLPFVLALLVQGYKSLTVLLLGACGSAAMVLLLDRSLPGVLNESSVGLLGAVGLLLIAATGLMSGLLVCGLRLLPDKSFGRGKLRSLVEVLIGFSLVPGVLLVLGMWVRWDYHPDRQAALPPAECLARSHSVRVAGVIYRVSSAPLFKVWLGDDDQYDFARYDSLRDFCARSSRGAQLAQARLLLIDWSEMAYSGDLADRTWCRAPKAAWVQDLCRGDTAVLTGYPSRIGLFAADEADSLRLGFDSGGGYADLLELRRQALARGEPLAVQVVGAFDRYDNHYWVARDGWTNAAGEPFTLRCYDNGDFGLSCSVRYRLQGRLVLAYDFHAQGSAQLPTLARQIDQQTRRMLAQLRQP
ncbi:MAG: hypothetical protein ABWY06_03720 [Pseudomonas sp.]|uniref:hypothetical protein n=1 Tax=Pseudomonas sp. TaxID=306 RepID=UPI003391E836